jgi:hypothetical protein
VRQDVGNLGDELNGRGGLVLGLGLDLGRMALGSTRGVVVVTQRGIGV